MSQLLLPLPAEPPLPESACLVMADLVGSTRIAHGLPLASYAALMAEFVQVLILSFEVHGGQVLQHQGDAVLALWPAGAAGQALRSAVETHDRAAGLGLARSLGLALQVRAGLASGEVITGMVGGQPSAYGLPVNYARRLCDTAGPGETLLCAATAQGVGSAVALAPRALPLLRGFGPESRAYRVVPAAPGLSPMKAG